MGFIYDKRTLPSCCFKNMNVHFHIFVYFEFEIDLLRLWKYEKGRIWVGQLFRSIDDKRSDRDSSI
jgi:hypothetical protein